MCPTDEDMYFEPEPIGHDDDIPYDGNVEDNPPAPDGGTLSSGARDTRQKYVPGSRDSGSKDAAEKVIAKLGSKLKKPTPPPPGGYMDPLGARSASKQPGGVQPTNPIFGCTDEAALNYNPLATLDDGSCSRIRKEHTKESLKVISPFSHMMREFPKSIKRPDLGMFKKLMPNSTAAYNKRAGIVVESQDSKSTTGKNTFKAGQANAIPAPKGSPSGTKEGVIEIEMAILYPLVAKAAWYVARLDCHECGHKLADDFMQATAIMSSLMLTYTCTDGHKLMRNMQRVKKLLDGIIDNKCQNC